MSAVLLRSATFFTGFLQIEPFSAGFGKTTGLTGECRKKSRLIEAFAHLTWTDKFVMGKDD
jgi:hypothetical protein